MKSERSFGADLFYRVRSPSSPATETSVAFQASKWGYSGKDDSSFRSEEVEVGKVKATDSMPAAARGEASERESERDEQLQSDWRGV